MKIFDQIQAFSNKVNFVDENNVVVGYDLTQDCCEKAGWFIDDTIVEDDKKGESERDKTILFDKETEYLSKHYNMNDFVFDNTFIKYDGRVVIFRLVQYSMGDIISTKYLHLFNVHNGYYLHGFDMTYQGNIIHKNSI